MRIPKQYGNYKVEQCPFCDKQATSKNKEDVPTCPDHKEERLPEMKCQCGDYLELRSGKYGAYFNCMRCGNINFRKALAMNPKIETKQNSQNNQLTNSSKIEQKKETTTKEEKITEDTEFYLNGKKRKEVTISSNDARYFD